MNTQESAQHERQFNKLIKAIEKADCYHSTCNLINNAKFLTLSDVPKLLRIMKKYYHSDYSFVVIMQCCKNTPMTKEIVLSLAENLKDEKFTFYSAYINLFTSSDLVLLVTKLNRDSEKYSLFKKLYKEEKDLLSTKEMCKIIKTFSWFNSESIMFEMIMHHCSLNINIEKNDVITLSKYLRLRKHHLFIEFKRLFSDEDLPKLVSTLLYTCQQVTLIREFWHYERLVSIPKGKKKEKLKTQVFSYFSDLFLCSNDKFDLAKHFRILFTYNDAQKLSTYFNEDNEKQIFAVLFSGAYY